MDLATLGEQFSSISGGAKQLVGALKALGAAGDASATQKQTLASLLAMAQEASGGLPAAAKDAREKRIASLKVEVADLKSTLVLDLSPETERTVRLRIDYLDATISELDMRDVADYSDVVSPEEVSKLVALLSAADEDVRVKQRAAAALSILVSAASLAAEVSSAVIAYV